LETLEYGCGTCGLTFIWHEELERHYVEAHLDMSNRPRHESQRDGPGLSRGEGPRADRLPP